MVYRLRTTKKGAKVKFLLWLRSQREAQETARIAAEDVQVKSTEDLLEVPGGMLGVISCFRQRWFEDREVQSINIGYSVNSSKGIACRAVLYLVC